MNLKNPKITKSRKIKSFSLSQQFYLKLVFVLLNCLIVFFSKDLRFLAVLVFFFTDFRIFKDWFKVILRLLPFFISYFLLGIFFDYDINSQILFTSKIAFWVLFSTYLLKTSSIEQYIKSSKYLLKFKFFYSFSIFLISTLKFIDYFIEKYQNSKKKNIIDKIVEIFAEAFNLIPKIEKETVNFLEKEDISPKFGLFSNLFLSFFIAIQSLTLLFWLN